MLDHFFFNTKPTLFTSYLKVLIYREGLKGVGCSFQKSQDSNMIYINILNALREYSLSSSTSTLFSISEVLFCRLSSFCFTWHLGSCDAQSAWAFILQIRHRSPWRVCPVGIRNRQGMLKFHKAILRSAPWIPYDKDIWLLCHINPFKLWNYLNLGYSNLLMLSDKIWNYFLRVLHIGSKFCQKLHFWQYSDVFTYNTAGKLLRKKQLFDENFS